MAFARGRFNQVGLSLATSANGTARNGSALALNMIQPGTLVLEFQSQITTASVAATFDIQVSNDNVTYLPLFDLTQAARTATAAGTGSPVTTNRSVWIPIAAHAYAYVRCVATLAGAATAGADQTKCTYRMIRYGLTSIQ